MEVLRKNGEQDIEYTPEAREFVAQILAAHTGKKVFVNGDNLIQWGKSRAGVPHTYSDRQAGERVTQAINSAMRVENTYKKLQRVRWFTEACMERNHALCMAARKAQDDGCNDDGCNDDNGYDETGEGVKDAEVDQPSTGHNY